MNQLELKKWINELIEKDELWRFYKSKEWRTVKERVLRNAHYECAICKKYGRITRYDTDKDGQPVLLSTVHHEQYVRKHPELALSETYTHNGKTYRNLIPICKACHNRIHDKARMMAAAHEQKSDQLTQERW